MSVQPTESKQPEKGRKPTVLERILRAIRLDWTVFREIAEDRNALTEAAIIVAVVTFLSGIGAFIGALITDATFGTAFLGFLNTWLIDGILLGWILWAVLTYFVGTMLFQGKTDIPEMLRVLGYASAPNLLGIFGFIPCVGWIIALVGMLLSLIAGVLAVREAMEFDTTKAIITVVVSWVIAFVLRWILSTILGVGTALTAGIFG
jgi:hypothetical protein